MKTGGNDQSLAGDLVVRGTTTQVARIAAVCVGGLKAKYISHDTHHRSGCASTRITQATLELQRMLGEGKDEGDSSNEAFLEA